MEEPSNKVEVEVTILGQSYIIKGNEPVDYIQNIADFVNQHLEEVKDYNSSISKVRVMVLGLLNLADKLYTVESEQEELESSYQKLEQKHQNLLDEYQQLKSDYQELQDDHQALLELVDEEERGDQNGA